MKIKQKKVIAAYKAITSVYDQKMDAYNARILYTMKKKLDPQFNFQCEQEEIYANNVGGYIDGNGKIQFPDKDAMAEYMKSFGELAELEVEIDTDETRPKLNVSKLNISPREIEDMEEFIQCEWD